MNRLLLSAAAAVLMAVPVAASAQGVTSTTAVLVNGNGRPIAEASVLASQPVPNPPPSTTERGPGNADTGYSGQLQGAAFRDVFERISADEQKMAGDKRGMAQLRTIKSEAMARKARHGGELRDWDRELINKKLAALEGA